MSVVPEHVWLEVIPIARKFDLTCGQIARYIAREYSLFISRQSVWSKMETFRNWEPRKDLK